MTLDRGEVRRFYDAFGSRQDHQCYEARAVEVLLAHGAFDAARSVVEFGCGTGKLAARLLADVLPPQCRYLCMDLSQTMISLCAEKTRAWPGRVCCLRTAGGPELPLATQCADRFVATYVLDLLPGREIRALLAEAHRVLMPGGLLCLAGLGHGRGPLSRGVARLWGAVYRFKPRLVGGCRPMDPSACLRRDHWEIVHREDVVSYGIPSVVLVARRLQSGKMAGEGVKNLGAEERT